ncbi:MAG: hypothetical protein LBV74_23175 [Tannerella sp.]|jgi:hypothetical protein|nr:hypothetical protein [Tannerella sp.]
MTDNIDKLLERYFEGETSAEEEAVLRNFFTTGDVPGNLEMYKPLFGYFDDEIKKEYAGRNKEYHPGNIREIKNIQPENNKKTGNGGRTEQTGSRKKLVLWLSGTAACAALLTGIFFSTSQSQKCPGSGNYVIIDGRCYTDAETVRSVALKTLHEISNDEDEFFSGKSSNPANIIEEQLKEFDSFFNE